MSTIYVVQIWGEQDDGTFEVDSHWLECSLARKRAKVLGKGATYEAFPIFFEEDEYMLRDPKETKANSIVKDLFKVIRGGKDD